MFRRVFLALAVLLTAGSCDRGDVAQPFAESRTPPDLAARFFMPEGWGWGYVQVGSNPPQRYGVATTWRAPRATVVILPDTGECAEAWFETANDLTRRSYSVWVLDRASECGSGRPGAPRDRVHIKSFEPDLSAVKALLRIVVRPNGDTPIILLGQGHGAILALRSVESGLKVDGLVLTSPTTPALEPWRPWSRETPDAFKAGKTHDPWRGHVTQAWMTANPDLRSSGPSHDWLNQAKTLNDVARKSAKGLGKATLIISPGPARPEDLDLCGAIGTCSLTPIKGAGTSLSLEADAWRTPWIDAVVQFIAAMADAARRVGKDRGAPAPPMVPSPVTEGMRPRDTASETDSGNAP